MNTDTHLRRQILRRRGQNEKLAKEVLEKLSIESRQTLLRILMDDEREVMVAQGKLNKLNRMGVGFLCR